MKIIAMDMGGTWIKYAVCDVNTKNGAIKFYKKDRYKVPMRGGNISKGVDVIADMAKFAQKVYKEHPEAKYVCTTAGGIIDVDNYKVLVSSEHKYRDFHMIDLKHIFTKYCKLPLLIINDVKAGALGELRYGRLKHEKNVNAVFLGIGTGIAAAPIINGKLYLGQHWAAGEIGPMVVNNHYYENRYCLPALIRRCQEIDNKIMTAEDCLRLAKRHRFIKNIVDTWFVGLIEGIISLTYVLDPKYFIFGGKITEDPYFNLKKIKSLMAKNVRVPALNSITEVKLVKAELGNDAALYGAASLVFDKNYKI